MTPEVLLRCLFLWIPCGAVVQSVPLGSLIVDRQAEFDKALKEFDQAQAIQLEQPDQARRLFRAAAQRFESLQADGIINGYLEFNLANCLLQAGDVGRAILHYRRAQRFIPGDPLLEDNLAVAHSRCLTSIRPTGRSAFLHSAFFWHYGTSTASRSKAAIIFFFGVWVLLTLRNFVRSNVVVILAMVCAMLALLAGGSLAVSYRADQNSPEGVVTQMDVEVSKGPGEGYQRLFEQPLQPGVEFTLRARTRSGWWNIELPDGNTGWIPSAAAELIPRLHG